jgi:hypothetical protein
MGIPLTGLTPAQTYPSLFKVSDNTNLTSTPKRMSDGLGNDTTIWISSLGFNNRGGGNIGTNTAIGIGALQANTTGLSNIAIGPLSLNSNTSGISNIGIGGGTLRLQTTGEYNIAIGNAAMEHNTTGSNNTAIGRSALIFNTIGIENVAIGSYSLVAATTASGNTAVGYASLFDVTTQSNNTAIGYYSNTSGFSGCLLLGVNCVATANNQVVIGSSTNSLGAIATETITPNRTWTVNINGANYKIPLLAL